MEKATRITFADLTHTGQLIAANTFPLGISMVAAYAKKHLGDEVDIEVFKYPNEFSEYLDSQIPTIACFSNYSWNLRLSHEFARRIKEVSPKTITVFGGPNFWGEAELQEDFLKKYSSIDCYIEFEGEIAFLKLYEALRKCGFDWDVFKKTGPEVPNTRYLSEGRLVRSDLGPKVDVAAIPSPYEMGLMDKFFDDTLIPMIQTTRGCPYTCTFCWEGGDYFNKIKRFTANRTRADLEYIAVRTNVADLCIVDANFGMFKGDLETTRDLIAIQKRYAGWPKTVLTATAKNHKERTMKIVEMLGNTLPPTAAVQSTDPEILANIRRTNVSQEALIELGKSVEKVGGQSEAELILCIEGDTKNKHFKTVYDMLDADMTFIRMYQFMMIPGTQSARQSTREKYQLETKFRVLPRCFGKYRFQSHTFPVAEIEEIVISSNTMSHDDYKACRNLHLTVEIFNNDSIFVELIQLLRQKSISRSAYIKLIHKRALTHQKLSHLYTRFSEEEKTNLSDTETALEKFTLKDNIVDEYIDQTYGTNELYKYRVLGIFNHLEDIHCLAFDVGEYLLAQSGHLTEGLRHYLTELHDFSLVRKKDLLNHTISYQRRYHYDFAQLLREHFACDPLDYYVKSGIAFTLKHSPTEVDLIEHYIAQYGADIIGLSRLVLRANLNRLYRIPIGVNNPNHVATEEMLASNKREHLQLIN